MTPEELNEKYQEAQKCCKKYHDANLNGKAYFSKEFNSIASNNKDNYTKDEVLKIITSISNSYTPE